MLVRTLALFLLVSGCHARDVLRDVSLTATVSSTPRTRDAAGTLAIVFRPTAPPVSGRDDALNEPGVPPSRLARCRSRYRLCGYEAHAIARALAETWRGVP
jgi:hypothetical protein